jgi:hypothetical protein
MVPGFIGSDTVQGRELPLPEQEINGCSGRALSTIRELDAKCGAERLGIISSLGVGFQTEPLDDFLRNGAKRDIHPEIMPSYRMGTSPYHGDGL